MPGVQRCTQLQLIVYADSDTSDLCIDDLIKRIIKVYAEEEKLKIATTRYSEGVDAYCRDIKNLGQLFNKFNKENKSLDANIQSCKQELAEQIQERKELEERVKQCRQETAQLHLKIKQMQQQVKSQQQRVDEQSEIQQELSQRVSTFKQGVHGYNQQVAELTQKIEQVCQESLEVKQKIAKVYQETPEIKRTFIQMKHESKETTQEARDLCTYYANAKKEVEQLIVFADQSLYEEKVKVFIKKGRDYVDCLYKRESVDEEYIKYLNEMEAFIPFANEQDQSLLSTIKNTIEEMTKSKEHHLEEMKTIYTDDKFIAVVKKFEKSIDFAFSILTLSFIFHIFQDALPKITHCLFSQSPSHSRYKKFEV